MLASIRYFEGNSHDSLQIAKPSVYLDFRYMVAELYSLWYLVRLGYWVTVLYGCRPACEYGTNQHGNSSHPL